MKQEIARWLEFADNDYMVAEHLYKDFYPKQLEIICYHAQQAAEKAIKAIILSTGKDIIKTHDITILLKALIDDIEIPKDYFKYSDILTRYGVIVRYPDEISIDEIHTKQALEYAKTFIDFSKKIISDMGYI